ncbi:MAG: hypothetical protein FWE45_05085 [Firmicutes bacterium]|nr:hypothetical protein [Bacillota bacterium]
MKKFYLGLIVVMLVVPAIFLTGCFAHTRDHDLSQAFMSVTFSAIPNPDIQSIIPVNDRIREAGNYIDSRLNINGLVRSSMILCFTTQTITIHIVNTLDFSHVMMVFIHPNHHDVLLSIIEVSLIWN